MINRKTLQRLNINVTERCNLKCSYCYLNARNKKIDLDEKTADKILNFFFTQTNNEKDKRVIAFWGGEPLLNFKIIKYIVYRCKDLKQPCGFFFSTNGTILTDEIIDFIKNESIDIQVSLDGDKKSHNLNRKFRDGSDSHHVVLNNIEKLKSIQGFKKFDLSIKATFYKTSLIKSIKYLDTLKIDYAITPAYNYTESYTISTETIANEVNLMMDFYINNIENGFFSKNKYNYRVNTIFKRILFNIIQNCSCSAGHDHIQIEADGRITPCAGSLCDKVEYGTIKTGLKLSSLDYFHKQNEIVKEISCKSCWILPYCGGPCYYMTYYKKKIDPIHCTFQKTIIERLFKYTVHVRFHDEKMKKLEKMFLEAKEAKEEIEFNSNKFINNSVMKRLIMGNNKTSFKMHKLIKVTSAKFIDLGEEGILYNENKPDNKYIINKTSSVIWDLLEGEYTNQEIAQEIATACEVNMADIEEDIYQQLATLQELGFVEKVKDVASVNAEE